MVNPAKLAGETLGGFLVRGLSSYFGRIQISEKSRRKSTRQFLTRAASSR
jgi:hypothetical protein